MKQADVIRDAKNVLRNLPTGEEYTDSEGNLLESVYLGSVFTLTPSGKYYLPFACSNVDACPRCDGKGCKFCGEMGSREAFLDSVFMEVLEAEANKLGGWIESGEGDPCDLFFVKMIKEVEYTD